MIDPVITIFVSLHWFNCYVNTSYIVGSEGGYLVRTYRYPGPRIVTGERACDLGPNARGTRT